MKQIYKGIAIMLCSALCTCSGQLCWKLSVEGYGLLMLAAGFLFYGFGALLMILALRYGELSVLHPMMSVGYVLSLLMGAVVLHENITVSKVVGILTIILGLVVLSSPERNPKK